MKRILYWIITSLAAIGMFFTGFLWRQPKINKLKKQIESLQKDNGKLLDICQNQQTKFRELLVQHKALKAFNFKKKAKSESQLHETLVMQYALKEYIAILLKRVKYQQELEKEEIRFFNIMEKFIDGKKITTTDKVNMTDFVVSKHKSDIKKLKECDFDLIMNELQTA